MGQTFSKGLAFFSPAEQEVSFLMLGFDGVGKQTISRQLSEVIVETISISNWQSFSLEVNKMSIHGWDTDKMDVFRPQWRHYYKHANGLIYVLDSTDTDSQRMGLAKDDTLRLMNDFELQELPVLCFLNKMDSSLAMSAGDEKLWFNGEGMAKSLAKRKFRVQPCSGQTGEGIHEGIGWLVTTAREKMTNK